MLRLGFGLDRCVNAIKYFLLIYLLIYIYESVVCRLLRVQVEMAGSSIFEYIHSHDHKELAEQLGLNQPKPGSSFYAPLGSDSSDEGSSTPNPPRSSTPSLSERGQHQGRNDVFRVGGGPIPWTRLLYRTKYG